MKTNFILLALATTVTCSSCNKEEFPTNPSVDNEPQAKQGVDYIPDITDCFTGITLFEGYVRFDNIASFRATIECLAEKTEVMESEFLDDWGHLSDSLINDKEDEINYHPELVYEAFETHFGLNSLRHKLNNDEAAWLNNIPLDTTSANIPDHVIGDKEFQTVLSELGIFLLQDTIYFIEPVGDYYRILNKDLTILDSLIQGNWGGKNKNVEYNRANGDASRSGCKASKSSGWIWKYNSSGTYGMKFKSGFYNIWPKVTWYAETQSRKRKNGKYKLYRTYINAYYGGTRYEKNSTGGCGSVKSTYSHNDGNDYKKSERDGETDWPDNNSSRWQSCSHAGGHYTNKVANWLSCPNW